ncbi:MAG: hypothetical protein VX294_14740 [Candidatus Latescibacterota bacterium]|nr:hypothetical protein [Candidatus Latescibacterota bacterium]
MIGKKFIGLLGLLSILTSCIDEEDNPLVELTADRDKVVGSWMIEPAQIAELIELDEDFEGLESYETTFNEDGTSIEVVTIFGITVSQESTWNLNGNKMTRTIDGESSEFTIVVTDTFLTMTDEEEIALIYKRK